MDGFGELPDERLNGLARVSLPTNGWALLAHNLVSRAQVLEGVAHFLVGRPVGERVHEPAILEDGDSGAKAGID